MNNSSYLKDTSVDQEYRNDGFSAKQLLVGAATVAGTVAAFKKGMFKPVVKKTIEKVANKKPIFSMAMNDMKDWINVTDELSPENSIFRNSILKNIKNGFSKDRGSMLTDTAEDFKQYLKKLKGTQESFIKNGGANNRDYMYDTDIIYNIDDMETALNSYSDNLLSFKEALKAKMSKTFLDTGTLSVDDAAKQLKRTGFREATLEDFFDIVKREDGSIRLYESKDFNFSSIDEKKRKEILSAREKIEKMLNDDLLTEDGFKIKTADGKRNLKLYEHNKEYNRLIIDKDILIDSALGDTTGNIVDLRNQMRSMKESVRNLSTEWQIPIIGVNPFRMLGGNKVGLKRNRIKFGTITEDNVAPFLTGVYGNSKDETIAALKDKVDILKGVKEGVTIIDGDVFRVADDGVGIFQMPYKSKKELIRISKWQDTGTNFFSPLEASVLKMGGINKREYHKMNFEDKTFIHKVKEFFDIGKQQSSVNDTTSNNIFNLSNPDNYIGKILDKIRFGKRDPFKYTDRSTFSNMLNPNSVGKNETFFAINKSTKFSEMFKDKNNKFGFNKEKSDKFFNQILANMNDYESVTKTSGVAHFFTERLNQTISKVGLGLSAESTKDVASTFSSLILRRLAPIYIGKKAWDVINMIGEDKEEGEAGNLEQKLLKRYSNFDIRMHKLSDKLKISNIAKNISNLTPGSDMLAELPGINLLNLSETAEEREKYWKSGYKAVRKGRYWSTNSTPFVGGRVKYHRANALRTSMADAKYSDSLYGSRKERLFNILDRDHYDNKHYYTRPYLMTSTAFDEIPFFGEILSSTAGKVIGKQKKMHSEYWNGDKVKSLAEVKAMEKNEELNKNFTQYGNLEKTNEYIEKSSMISREASMRNLEATNKIVSNKSDFSKFDMILNDVKRIFKVNNKTNDKFDYYSKPIYKDGILDYSTMPGVQHKDQNSNNFAYRTVSGKLTPLNLGDKRDVAKKMKLINKDKNSPTSIPNTYTQVDLSKPIITDEMIENSMYSNVKDPYNISTSLKDSVTDLANIGGIYGFGVTGFVTGNPGEGESRIETSGYSRSFSREFYEAELGGFGDDISEIFRRLVQGRRKDVNYYNPIKNRMPEYLPGDDGFTNFKRGDPYSKINYGEERLPGEGYERLNNIKSNLLFEMRVGSSTMGKTKDDMIKHFLHADDITDESIQRIVAGGTKTHEKVEAQMLKAGIAKDVEGKIEDKENGIVGWYDVRAFDATSKSGEAIMDIKTISDKGFQEILKTGKPKDEHQRQVNWYLHNTNKKNKGYVYYINRDNPNQRLNIGFNYSEDLYNSSMDTLKAARSDVMGMLERGDLSRGDLYKTMDKYRILADVAPYSQEFINMNAHMSSLALSNEEKEEVKAIRERVAEVKEPLRTYDYRFKRNATVSSKVEIGKKIDNERYQLKGSDEIIKLAGVNITKKNKYDIDYEKYQEAEEYINKVLSEGENVKIEYAKDPLKMRKKDMFKSINAVVYSDGKNINNELIKMGYAEEDEKDFSAAGVKARFNSVERTFGKAWESIAHLDTFANTKLLQARTAVEDYERRHVFNKDFKKWQNPIDDFIKPFIWTNMNRTVGTLVGAGLGFMFGGKSPFGRLVGTAIGATTVGAAQVYKGVYEATQGEKWIPKEVREKRDINEYMDKLSFIKNRRLFELYSEKALREDGQDVKQILIENKKIGNSRKRKMKNIESLKVDLKKGEDVSYSEMKSAGVDISNVDTRIKPLKIISGVIKDKFQKEKIPEIEDEIELIQKNMAESGNYDEQPQEAEETEVKRKRKSSVSNQIKRGLKKGVKNGVKAVKKAAKTTKKEFENVKKISSNIDEQDEKDIKAAINKSHRDLKESKNVFNLSNNALKAIDYYNKSEATMYGYDPGEEVNNFIKALPKHERQYFRDFTEADTKDRKRILEIAPKYMQRALRSAYKMDVPEKEALSSYFKEHYLPGESWEGWRENYDLESMKVKVIQQQNKSLQEFDKWEQDKVKADMYGKSNIPNINKKTRNINEIKNKLDSVLLGAGYSDLRYSFSHNGSGKSNIDFNITEKYEERFNNKLRERLMEDGYL